jgi:hypothetical protein
VMFSVGGDEPCPTGIRAAGGERERQNRIQQPESGGSSASAHTCVVEKQV